MSDSLRYGGAQGEGDDEAKAKADALQAKKAEVRKRLEEAGQKKKKKKGFLTPERKKKLRKLLMMKAAENMKQQQMKSEQERQNVLKNRTVALPDVDSIEDKGKLESIYNELFQKMVQLEEEKYDINQLVMAKDGEINELTIAVNDLRGKFVKPTLKKVSKYDNKFKKFAPGGAAAGVDGEPAKGPKEDFRSKLKVVKKDIQEEIAAKTKKSDKPDWKEQAKAGPKAPVPAESEEQKKPVEKPVEEKKEEAPPPPAAEPAPAAAEPEAAEEGEEEEGGEEEEEEDEEEEE